MMPLDIVIVVPTFRRPQLLKALLLSLIDTLGDMPVAIVIADNDCDVGVRIIVEGFQSSWPDLYYLAVGARGLSNVRNALIEAATNIIPDWRWLVMLDDDGIITPSWPRCLIKCGETYQAHMVGGPVEGVLPTSAGFLARHSIYASRSRTKTGIVNRLNSTQNLAISRTLLELLPLPLFSIKYNQSGGEDYDLFRRASNAGAILAWCDEDVIYEPTPLKRLTASAVLSRYFTTGMYMVQIDAEYDGRTFAWFGALKGIIGSFLRLILKAFSFDRAGIARAILGMVHFWGRLWGLLGKHSARYADTNSTNMQP